jgi:hypothetical protein
MLAESTLTLAESGAVILAFHPDPLLNG